ncbi:MAG: DNA polymerase III subunit gamma/tau [Candidatus Omnitrophica bacterium]|nr:DNA polymerase III subunit gamma/tau [Candidatus Omnitrophota bacterium]
MYQVLAQKYRPRGFDDVLGQEAAVRTLKNAVSSGRIANAYMFSGPRGVGKTSLARLLAKIINCDKPSAGGPCNKCPRCEEITKGSSMDVLEIDGASNRGIDEIRTLRESVRFLPSTGKYKVYVIDEVHMLTSEAFNALLKTLEEPPEHVKFIFATTEAHKVLPTIMSRCQKFDFKRIPPKLIYEQVKDIARKEKIEIDEKAMLLIARAADGSLRDALVILDQMVSFTAGKVTAKEVLDLLGMVGGEIISDLSDAVILKAPEKVARILDDLINNGKDPVFILNNLMSHFRDILILKSAGSPTTDMVFHDDELAVLENQAEKMSIEEVLYILQNLAHCGTLMKGTMYTRVPLEISLIKLTKRDSILSIGEVLERLEKLESGENPLGSIQRPAIPSGSNQKPVTSDQRPVGSDQKPAAPSGSNQKPVTSNQNMAGDDEELPADELELTGEPGTHWDMLLKYLKNKKFSVYTFIKQAKPIDLSEKKAVIAFDKDHAFNKEMLETPDNLDLIKESLESVFGARPALEIRVLDRMSQQIDGHGLLKKKQEEIRKTSNPAIEAALDVFGGKIVRDHID